MRHSAVLLAGGRSSRMGRDKAQIIVGGKPLWARQLEVLAQTAPAELLISGPADGAFCDAACRIIPDASAGHGPLGGIVTALGAISSPALLVLAVDLPAMTPLFLGTLVERAAAASRGMVCVQEDGRMEPLVAVYPQAALAIGQEQLRGGERRLVSFVERLEAEGLLGRHPVSRAESQLFANWNTPEDFAPGGEA